MERCAGTSNYHIGRLESNRTRANYDAALIAQEGLIFRSETESGNQADASGRIVVGTLQGRAASGNRLDMATERQPCEQ